MNHILLVIALLISVYSCQDDDFCSCYIWRNKLIEAWDEAGDEITKKKIEDEMNEYDQSCQEFNQYIGKIDTEEELEEYFEKVKACE